MHLHVAGFAPMLVIVVITIVSIVLIVKLMLVGFLFLLHPHTIGAFAGLVGIIFLVLLGISVANHGGIQALINNFQPPKQNNANAVVILAQPKIQAPAVVAMAEVKPAAAETKAEPAEAKPVTRHAADTASNHDSKSPPAWIDQPPHREGDSYFVVVKLDADTSLTERDEWLDQRMLVAARDYIDERLFPGEDVSKIVKISAKNLYDNCLREIYPASGLTEAGKEVYARLEFDRRFREEVEGLYRGTLEGRSGTATGGGRFNWHGGARGSLHLLENDVQRPAGGR